MAKRINKPLDVKRFMESNPLAVGFVLEAIDRYARSQIHAPKWEGQTFINQDLWRELAQAASKMVND